MQRLQLQFPDLVIRTVPDHPPPPYSPPVNKPPLAAEEPHSPFIDAAPSASALSSPLRDDTPISTPCRRLSKSDLQQLASTVFHAVPSSQPSVMRMANTALDFFCQKWFSENVSPSCGSPPAQLDESPCISPLDANTRECQSAYRLLIFDAVKHLVLRQYELHGPGPVAHLAATAKPWRLLQGFDKRRKQKMTAEALRCSVTQELKVLMGWSAPLIRESQMLKWAKKRRDVVDQVRV